MQLPSQPMTQEPQPDPASRDSNEGDGQMSIVEDLYAASKAGNADAVKQVLGSQEDYKWSEDDVAAAASLAADGGHLEIIQLLLERKLLRLSAALALGNVSLLQALCELQNWTAEGINQFMAAWPNL
jgi:hypothetical protein